MNRHPQSRPAGFTLLEILITVAIIGIVAAIAIPLYGNYTTRARATDIVSKFDAAKSATNVNIAGETVIGSCDDLATSFGPPSIPDEYARIAYGFEAVSNGAESGYRPVLTICARAASQGVPAVKVARAAHDEFAKNMPVEGGAVLTDTVVSFALPLTDQKRIVCKTPSTAAFTACGDAVAVPKPPATNTPPAASSNGCPPGKERVVTSQTAGATVSGCYTPCAPGQMRNPVPPLWWCVPDPAAASAGGSTVTTTATPTAVTCSGGQQLGADGKTCACPAGQQFDGAQCFAPATCGGGQVLSADQKSCACPPGQTLQNGVCRTPPPTVQQQLNTCLATCSSISNPGHRHQCERDCQRQHQP
ncbi:MAG: prepilin-type N-terminal cleavage/methylation domain-containing protein [Burkholderiales bacterium]